MVVATTALCWYVGIVAFNSDYAFTVTNVVIHGVPYLVLVYWYGWVRRTGEPRPAVRHGRALLVFLAAVWALAFAEELLWDRLVWHERGWLFGAGWQAVDLKWLRRPAAGTAAVDPLRPRRDHLAARGEPRVHPDSQMIPYRPHTRPPANPPLQYPLYRSASGRDRGQRRGGAGDGRLAAGGAAAPGVGVRAVPRPGRRDRAGWGINR